MLAKTRQKGFPLFVKRAIDTAIAGTALCALSPLMSGVAIAIVCTMGRPVFFRQIRPGRKCRPFAAYKFRTMLEQLDDKGETLPDAQRLTILGRIIRKASIDELPQLWNVLCGDMSLVGPRPLLMRYLPRYNKEQLRRHDVLPGITGWAQINGRNAVDWNTKFELDLWYVDNWSIFLDMTILAKTLLKVLTGEGISQPGHATMPEFMGNFQNTF